MPFWGIFVLLAGMATQPVVFTVADPGPVITFTMDEHGEINGFTLPLGMSEHDAIVKIAQEMVRSIREQYDRDQRDLKMCFDGWERSLDIIEKSLRPKKKSTFRPAKTLTWSTDGGNK